MPTIPDLRTVQINYLLRKKNPQYIKALGEDRLFPKGYLTSPEELQRIEREAGDYAKKLRSMPAEELTALYQQEWSKEQAKAESKRFFNRPDAAADFNHWSKAKAWSLDEAIALSFGKDPSKVNWAGVKLHVGQSPFAEKYAKLRDLAQRALQFAELYDPVMPGIFIAWAQRLDIDFPPELEELVVKYGRRIGDWKTAHDNMKTAHDKINEAYEKLLAFNNENVKLAKEQFAARDKLIAELRTKLEGKATAESAPDGSLYEAPYITLMLRAIRENGITAGNQGKKEQLVEWFRAQETKDLPISGKRADMMASLIRLPESGKGGNSKK